MRATFRAVPAVLWVGLSMLACKDPPAAGAGTASAGADEAPPTEVAAAITALKTSLGERLKSQLKTGGPVAAIGVCHEDAPKLTAAAGREGLRIGRTSHKLRNPANEPPEWARAVVAAAAGKKIAGVQRRHVFDLGGGKKGYLQAIDTAPLCLTCHGAPGVVSEAVRSQLAALYPQDRATGFAEGDLRGWFWAEWGGAR